MTEESQREIGRVKISESQQLVATLVNGEKLDLRTWVDTEQYKGPTKRGLRFYLFDGIWDEFKKLVKKVNREYEKLS